MNDLLSSGGFLFVSIMLKAFTIIGVSFGILAAFAAFVNSYEGYSRFPAITKRKKIIISLEYAAVAFLFTLGATIAMILLIGKIAE